MIEYKFNKEFPMPFVDGVVSIDSQDSMALMWLCYEEVENLKTKIIDKLNGKAINFNGRFFISDGKKSSGIDFNQNADANHCLLYFLEDGQDEPIRLMMVRGWGHLTGCGALNLEPSIAADIQDGFLNWVRDCLNLKFKNVEEGEQFDIKIPDCDIKQESVIEKTKSQINENCKLSRNNKYHK